MTYVYGHHMVKDFNTWKPYFDGDDERRRAAGIKLVHLFQDANDSNNVHFLFQAENPEAMKKMMESEDMGKIMEEAGVVGEPHFHVLNSV